MSKSVVLNTKSNTNTSNSSEQMFKYQHIAPAPEVSSTDGKIMPVQKYIPRMHNAPYNVDQTQSVVRRNARERNRVKQVNNSFAKLRQHIPQYVIKDLTKGGGRGPQKKISKVDTLRIAVEYIRRLQDLVEDLNDNSSVSGMSDNSTCSTFSLADSSASLAANSPTAATTTYATTEQCFGENHISPLPAFEQTQIRIQQHQKQQQQHQYQNILPPTTINQTKLDVGCHSPTSSFNSSMSFDSGHFEAPQHMSPVMASHDSRSPLQLKFETFNSFNLHEEDCSPDDEEILDYISLWQDQQS